MRRLICLVSSLILPPVSLCAQDVPHRLSLRGLCGLTREVKASQGRQITGMISAGDVDLDGKEDLLIRQSPGAASSEKKDFVVLLYGQALPAGAIELSSPEVRKCTTLTGKLRLDDGEPALAAGEDVNGDGYPDLLFTSGREEAAGGPAVILLLGGASLPQTIEGEKIGEQASGTYIVDSTPKDPKAITGEIIALCPDINGDGLGEILVAETAGLFGRQKIYVIFGSASLPRLLGLSEVGSGIGGIVVKNDGPDGSRGFKAAMGLGDVDGDGLGDLGFVVKNIRHDPDEGFIDQCFILFGREVLPWPLSLDLLPAGYGLDLRRYGNLSRGGDVTGDGLEDPILFWLEDKIFPWPGLAQILFGRPRDELPEVIDRASFEENGLGTTIVVDRQLSGAGGLGTHTPGLTLARGNDADGDGKAEVLLAFAKRHVVYPTFTLARAGVCFVLKGSDALPEEILTDVSCMEDGVLNTECPPISTGLASGLGIQFEGAEANDEIGHALALLCDFDGDARGDAVVGGTERVVFVPGSALDPGIDPWLGGIYPAEGPLGGGNKVVLLGAGFTRHAVAVRFGGMAAPVLDLLGSGVLVVEAPPGGIPGLVDVTVTLGGREAGGCPTGYTYLEPEGQSLEVGGDPERSLVFQRQEPRDYWPLGVAAGDLNGDGKTDLAMLDIGLRLADTETRLHVILGDGQGPGATIELESLSPDRGPWLLLPSLQMKAPSPSRLCSGGDLNGDVLDDLVFAVERLGLEGSKEWMVVLGRPSFPDGELLTSVPGIVRISPGAGSSFHGAAAIVPDVSGDGIDDLLLSMGRESASDLYVVRGFRDLPSEILLESLAADGLGAHLTTGLRLTAVAGFAQDFDGDGHGDVFFGGPGYVQEGALVMIRGGQTLFDERTISLDGALSGRRGWLVAGSDFLKGLDFSAAVPGDLDADGLPEFFFRQDDRDTCEPGPCSAEGYVFDVDAIWRHGFDPAEAPAIAEMYGGKPAGLPDFVPSTQEEVVRLTGAVRGEGLGGRASPAGDFDGDEFPDLLLASVDLLPSESGTSTSHVVFGNAGLASSRFLDLTRPAGAAVTIRGTGIPDLGTFVQGSFDWNGDGFGDVLLASSAARAEVIFGKGKVELPFLRGDANADGDINITDPIFTLGFLFLGNRRPDCLDALDADDDGHLVITDAIYVLLFLFTGGPAPRAPYPDPGFDATSDEMLCADA